MCGSEAANISSEEYLELKRQLKSLNKPAVKSIETVYGDIFDCVDIYKQPALDHPLLKDHKIQMWPTSFPKGLESTQNRTASEMGMKVELPDGGCPEGTVPIRRTQMKDLLRMKSQSKLRNKSINDARTYHHWVAARTQDGGRYYGTRADMNVWNPRVDYEDQYSRGQFWIMSGEPGTYNTGVRMDGLCTSNKVIAPGSAVEPVSAYNGKQYHVTLQAFKDVVTHNWWVAVGGDDKNPVGYFPETLFNSLAERASAVLWGGEVFSPGRIKQPQMGSGHFPNEGYGKADFMKMVMTVDDQNKYIDARSNTYVYSDEPDCYNVGNPNQYGDKKSRRFLYFGGPGC
ncbi:hypothetical protein ACLOJK_029585 [Asimina triloba]